MSWSEYNTMAYNPVFISTGRNPGLTGRRTAAFKQVLSPKETLEWYSQASLLTVWKSLKKATLLPIPENQIHFGNPNMITGDNCALKKDSSCL